VSTPLAAQLAARIRAEGPIPLSSYMAECLLHPTLGYYTTRDPLGAAGDFTTAPEISQMFGEMLGLALAQAWVDQGRPARFTLAELGPGRGTLMADVLRAGRAAPGFVEAAQVMLVEASPVLRAAQAERVPQAAWADRVDQLPEGAPLFLLANEFFDALPVRQFQRTAEGWAEVHVGLDGDALRLALRPAPGVLPERLADTTPGDIVEVCPALPGIIAEIAARMARGGCGIIVDYGDWRSRGDTVQAVRAHKPEPILATPGGADLTAHVDFEAIAAAAPGQVSAMVPQGVLLERLGVTPRAQTLAKDLSGAALESHVAAHRRLTHPGEMGHLFKAIALGPKSGPKGGPFPPGFTQ
jgi:SAM-dependent MidA family methyltransferase